MTEDATTRDYFKVYKALRSLREVATLDDQKISGNEILALRRCWPCAIYDVPRTYTGLMYVFSTLDTNARRKLHTNLITCRLIGGSQ